MDVVLDRSDHWSEAVYARAVAAFESRNHQLAKELASRAVAMDPGELRYQLFVALLLSAGATRDLHACQRELARLWAEHPVRSIDLTLAKARCELALARPLIAIETLASRISYNIAQAAAAAASTTIFSSSENEAMSTVYAATAAAVGGLTAGVPRGAMTLSAHSGNSDDLSRAAGFLSEPAVDILQHKIVLGGRGETTEHYSWGRIW